MGVITEKSFSTWDEAARLALVETSMQHLDPGVLGWFSFVEDGYDKTELRNMTQGIIERELKKEFKAQEWHGLWWYVPIPRTKYVQRDLPRLTFEVDLYFSASVDVTWYYLGWSYGNCRMVPCAVVAPLHKKAEKFSVPLVLLKALAEGNMADFQMVEKEKGWTTWHIDGFDQEARIPDSLRDFLSSLSGKSLGKSLEKSGLIGPAMGVIVNDAMVSFPASTKLDLPPSAAFNEAEFVSAMAGLGISKSKAEEMLKNLPQDINLEMAIQLALKNYGAGAMQQ